MRIIAKTTLYLYKYLNIDDNHWQASKGDLNFVRNTVDGNVMYVGLIKTGEQQRAHNVRLSTVL
jgi:hypothetical protein